MSMMIAQELNREIPHIESINESINQFLSDENLNKLQSVMHIRKVAAGTHLFWDGEEAEKMYYIISGRVKLRASSERGKDFLLSIKEKGSLIGEFGGFTGKLYYNYRADVEEETEIGIIHINDLKKLLYQFGNFAVEFMSWIGWTQRIMQNKLYDFLFFDKQGALASTLIKLTTTHGVKCKDGILIGIELTNKDLGDFIGTTRESVNRLLNGWKREGIVEMYDHKVVILQMERLYEICEYTGGVH
ncbi:Crp/Fnr family transcriptional regulator [Bacillus sinesaloumensis]|uniref:Crp/Fnr family transcriptional regulator n=1 Tax=Litchfieldia sinesaloumensis TaxID=1926280 RepID=UPI0009887A4E|nr:Crp/Fnr family transcriptional regulator [Bacillus sinesaloumensis]